MRTPIDHTAGITNVLYVHLVYFGNDYIGTVGPMYGNSVVVTFKLRSGRVLTRRLAIVPSREASINGRNHRVRLTWASADVVTKALTSFDGFDALLNAKGGYRPTIMQDGVWALLANAYDAVQYARKDARRVYRRAA